MYLTWLDNNSWLIELEDQRILLDPWLVGDLTFGNQNWLFKASRSHSRPIPDAIDLILLSQGLEDHAHPPTLNVLDRSIPVLASPNAAKVVRKLGYKQVTAIAHGESFILANRLRIQAVPGSPIGPLLTENGYLLRGLTNGSSLYYEPHGFHSPVLQQEDPVDVVITPLVNLEVPLLGPILQGAKTALQVTQWLKPRVIIPTAAGGDITSEGLLMYVIRSTGSVAEVRATLAQNNLTTTVLELKAGDRLDPLLVPTC